MPGDLVRVGPGDQVVADGTLEQSDGLELDESILSGESRPVARRVGEEVRSGSFAADGVGAYTVTAVGAQSYASRLTGEARSFRHPRSPLERSLNLLLFILVGAMVPLALTLGYSLWHRHTPLHTAVPTSVAAVVTLVPEGLVLLTSLTFAVAAMRMARRGALAQQLNAIESLASVDIVCLDKTGTLTEPALRVAGLVGPESLAERAGPLRGVGDGAERDARGNRDRVPGGVGERRRAAAVHVAATLRRPADRRRRLRPRRAGALHARRPRGTGRRARPERVAASSRSAQPNELDDAASLGHRARPARRTPATRGATDGRVVPQARRPLEGALR